MSVGISADERRSHLANFIWLRDVMRDEPDLFDLIYQVQSESYRRNSATQGQVWSKETFATRAVDYVLFGDFPEQRLASIRGFAAETVAKKCAFIFGRLLPSSGPPFLCLKLSGIAGQAFLIRKTVSEIQQLGIPVIAAVDPRLASIAIRMGFTPLPRTAATSLVPLFIDSFLQPPWTFRGIGENGEIRVSHPELCDPSTGETLVHSKRILYTPGFLTKLLRNSASNILFSHSMLPSPAEVAPV